jgi:hypothetical protein
MEVEYSRIESTNSGREREKENGSSIAEMRKEKDRIHRL